MCLSVEVDTELLWMSTKEHLESSQMGTWGLSMEYMADVEIRATKQCHV